MSPVNSFLYFLELLFMPIFPERLKQLRSEHKVTQSQLAKAIGVTDRACRRYEAGENEPTLSVLQNMADFFNVSLDYLTGRIDYSQDADGNIKVEAPVDIPGRDALKE